MIASVSGSSMRKRVPSPGAVSSASVPPSSRTALCTTSMPTPRPAARSAASRVEKPGAQRRSSSCAPSSGPSRDRHARSRAPAPHRLDVDAAAVVGNLERDDDRRRWRR